MSPGFRGWGSHPSDRSRQFCRSDRATAATRRPSGAFGCDPSLLSEAALISDGTLKAASWAPAVLTANATPATSVDSLVIPLNTPEAVDAWARTDLYDYLNVTDPAISANVYVTGISHTITPDKWLMGLEFSAPGRTELPTVG